MSARKLSYTLLIATVMCGFVLMFYRGGRGGHGEGVEKGGETQFDQSHDVNSQASVAVAQAAPVGEAETVSAEAVTAGGGVTASEESDLPTAPSLMDRQAAILAESRPVVSRDSDRGEPGIVFRESLWRTSMKYSLIRVEERVSVDARTGEETVISRDMMVGDHVIVQPREDLTDEAVRAIAAAHGLEVRERLRLSGAYLLAIPEPELDSVPDTLSVLAALGADLRFSEPDHMVFTMGVIPNDALFDQLYGLHNTGQTGGTADADIDAPEAWQITTGSHEIVVAVIDTGIDWNHPDLAENIYFNIAELGFDANGNPRKSNGVDEDNNGFVDDWVGWNFYSNNNNPMDDNMHGTHCAGTIGAVGNNSIGVAGVAWRVRMLPIKFLGANGGGFASGGAESLLYAGIKNVHLTSNSWGGGGNSALIESAVAHLNTLGIPVIAAAGNNGSDLATVPAYPAAYTFPNVVTVIATDHRDQIAPFSNFGTTLAHIAAPGVNTMSTINDNRYRALSGTSMATPHVAGAMALGYAMLPDAGMDFMIGKLLGSVDVKSNLATRCSTSGRLNVHRLLLDIGLSFRMVALSDAPGEGRVGDNNGIVSPGETVTLSLEAVNGNPAPLSNVAGTLTLIQGAPYVTLLRSSVTYGTVAPGGGTALPAEPYLIQISPDAPTPLTVRVRQTATADGLDPRVQEFSFVVYDVVTVSGTVRRDGVPFAGVTVELNGVLDQMTAVTNSAGEYLFTGVRNDSYAIRATGSGLVPTANQVLQCPPGHTGVDFDFQTVTLSGHVRVQGSNTPIANATVTAQGPVTQTATTNASGFYTMNLVMGSPNHSFEVWVDAPNYPRNASKFATLPPSQSLDFHLSRAQIQVDITAVNETVTMGRAGTVRLNISNPANADLFFAIADLQHPMEWSLERANLAALPPDWEAFEDLEGIGFNAGPWGNFGPGTSVTVSRGPFPLDMPFPFGQRMLRDLWVNSQGLVYFGETDQGRVPILGGNPPIPFPEASHLYPKDFISLYWDENIQSHRVPTQVLVRQRDQDTFQVHFRNTRWGIGSTMGNGQIVLKSDGTVYLFYDRVVPQGTRMTSGVSSMDTLRGTAARYYTWGWNSTKKLVEPPSGELEHGETIRHGDAFRFRPVFTGWLGWAPRSQRVHPGVAPMEVELSFDSNQLGVGVHTTTLRINHNDVTRGPVDIPVTITVAANPANQAPVAVDAVFTTQENIPVEDVLAGASDPDGDAVTFELLTPPAHGRVEGQGLSQRYIPDPFWHGTDSFTYRLRDYALASDPATITIHVQSVEDGPKPRTDLFTVAPGTPTLLDVTANDVHPDGLPLILSDVGIVLNGSAVIQNNKLLYTPPAGFQGKVMIPHTVSDSAGRSAQSQATVYVMPLDMINFEASDLRTIHDRAFLLDETVRVGDDGRSLEMIHPLVHTEVKVHSPTFDIGPNTYLEFDFRSTAQGSSHGITLRKFGGRWWSMYVFRLFGTSSGDNRNYTYNGNGNWQSFRIHLGRYVLGDNMHLGFFTNPGADSQGLPQGHSEFRNIRIFNEGSSPVVNSPPPNFAADASQFFRVRLSWSAPPNPNQIKTYRIYRNGLPLTTTGRGSLNAALPTEFFDNPVPGGISLSYQIAAVSWDDVESALSSPVTVTTRSDPGDLVIHYEFEETGGTVFHNSVGNWSPATFRPFYVDPGVTGRFGRGVNFRRAGIFQQDPTGPIVEAPFSNYERGGQFTLSLWITGNNYDPLGHPGDWPSNWSPLIQQGRATVVASQPGTLVMALFRNNMENTNLMNLYHNLHDQRTVTDTTPLRQTYVPFSVFQQTVWKHLVMSAGPEGLKYYMNGQLLRHIPHMGGHPFNATGPIRIGCTVEEHNGLYNNFNRMTDGVMDDVRFYSRTLSDAEVLALYETGNINRRPVAVADQVTLARNETAVVSLLANDWDPDGDPITFVGIDSPQNGTLVVQSSGPGDLDMTVSFTPDTDWYGEEWIAYRISDGQATGEGYLIVNVLPPLPAPSVAQHSPEIGFTPPGISSLRFTFSLPVDPASFSLDDVASFTGPDGALSVSGHVWESDTVLRLDFAPLTAVGTYTLELGPDIRNLEGRPMNRAYTAAVEIFALNAPEAPTQLTATTLTDRSVRLTWQDNALSEDGFRIEFTTTGAVWEHWGDVPANTTQAEVTGLEPATAYTFRVRAFNSEGNSPFSNLAQATTLTQGTVTGFHVINHGTFNGANQTFTRGGSGTDNYQGVVHSFPPVTLANVGDFVEMEIRWTGGGVNNVQQSLVWGMFAGDPVTGNAQTAITGGWEGYFTAIGRRDGTNNAASGVYRQGAGPVPLINHPTQVANNTNFSVNGAGGRIHTSGHSAPWNGNSNSVGRFRVERISETQLRSTTVVPTDWTSRSNSGTVNGVPYTVTVSEYQAITRATFAIADGGPVTLNGLAIAGGASFTLHSVVLSSLSTGSEPETAPQITSQPQSVTVHPGGSASFSVTATGNPEPEYQWFRNGVELPGATASTLNVNPVTAGDFGSYHVVVSNSVDSVESQTAQLIELLPPAAPGGLTATATGPTSIRLDWSDNSNSESGFEIYNAADVLIATVGSNVSSYTVSGLAPETTYSFKVRAVNAAGASAFTALATATTEDDGTPRIRAGDTLLFNVTAAGETVGGNWNEWTSPEGVTLTTRTVLSAQMVRHSDGQNTGVELAMELTSGAGFGRGGAINAFDGSMVFPVSGVIPENAQRRMTFHNQTNQNNPGHGRFVFSGLDDSLVYQLSFMSRNPNVERNALIWLVQPGTAQQVSVEAHPHLGPFIHTVSGIQPVNGRIVLETDLRSANVPNMQHVSAMELTAMSPHTPFQEWLVENGLPADTPEGGTVTLPEGSLTYRQLFRMGARRQGGVWSGVLTLRTGGLNGNGTMQLLFPARGGRSYQLQGRTSLMEGDWVNLGAPIDAETDLDSHALEAEINGNNIMFFRLRIVE